MRVVAQNLSSELTLVEKVWKLNVTKTYIFKIQREFVCSLSSFDLNLKFLIQGDDTQS